jgi:hypothetical protein
MPSVSPFLLAWDRIPVRAITIFCPFPPLFSFFCIFKRFYTNMNIFITLLENVNKSRTSANNLSLTISQWTAHLLKICHDWKHLHNQFSTFACDGSCLKNSTLFSVNCTITTQNNFFIQHGN